MTDFVLTLTTSIYGILYLHLVTIPLLFGPVPVYGLFSYRWQNGTTGLACLGAGSGSIIGTLICAKYLNKSYAYMAARKRRKTGSDEAQSEFRLPFLQLGMLIVPLGLIMFAWSAKEQTHWIVPLLGAAIFAVGMLMGYVCIQTYLVDTFDRFAASALAATILSRGVVSCIFSVVGVQLYKNLGYAWYVNYCTSYAYQLQQC
jgi:MFS family permease